MMSTTLTFTEQKLIAAQQQAHLLYEAMVTEKLVQPGVTELDLSNQIYALADRMLGIKKFWHKRIVRSGQNTLCPYHNNPPNLTLAADDMVFFDFGPIFEGFEADIGRTFVLGDDPDKQHLAQSLGPLFETCRHYYLQQPDMTGAMLYRFFKDTVRQAGFQVSTQGHCGHLIGRFPHERNLGEKPENYICPENHLPMSAPDTTGNPRYWILEIHIVSPTQPFGGFYEDLLSRFPGWA